MKKIIALFVFIVTSSVYAQNSGITYQAVIYNPSTEILPGNNNPNVVLAEKNICLRFSISDANSSVEYQEVQKVKTDEFGMVNLIVGEGDQVSGYAANFDAIIWNSSNKNLKVEIDTNGNCSNFIEISNQKFASVPFAFASKVAETVSGIVPIVNGGTGAATVAGAKTNLDLNNVDNTSDLNKPVSKATQTALDAKAPLASPGFTGIPTAPTAAAGTSTTQIATTAFVNAALATAGSPDATATQKGRIQLAGDLGGTADAPTVPGLANKENAANKSTDTSLGNSDILFPTQKAVKTYVDNQVSSGVVDATTSNKGKIQLAGDLSGTADAPTVPGLLSKEPTITAGTISQYYRGDKSWQNLDKTAVGLNNVDNTSDSNKPVSSAVQTALNAKEDASNKSTDTLLGTSNLMFPTQNAVKTYVDNQIATSSTPEATSSVKGKIQLGGDLAGTGTTASAPKISAGAISAEKLADNAVTNAKLGEIVAIAKGGTGSNMNTTAGYVKQATTGANFTTVSSIPVTDVTGAVRKVNGVQPDTDGNVAVIIGRVFTGATVDPNLATSIINANPARQQSDIYIVADGSNPNNGRTFIYDGTNWLEVATNLSTTDARYVNVAGDTLEGNLTFPTGKKIIIDDAPSNPTDAANKAYVDTKVAVATNSGTTNFVPKFSGTSPSKILANSSIFDNGTEVGIGTITPSSTLHIINPLLATDNINANAKVLTLSRPTTFQTKWDNIAQFNLGSYAVSTGNTDAAHTRLDLDLNDGSSIATSNVMTWQANGNVGIGTTAPATRLEIRQGIAGNSGLRLTNLTASSSATTASSKVLGVNNNGDVILTNIPGTQNIVSFSTATHTTSGVVFTPNLQADQSVVYQSATDSSLWTYNGTTYVTYTPPATTAWNLAGTTNDAGGTKVSSISRTGNVGIGISSPSARFHANTPSGINNVARFTTEGTGTNWANIGLGNNSGVWSSIASGDSKFQIRNFTNDTSILHADLVSGNVGVGTATPATRLHVNSASPATNTVNVEGVFRMQRPQSPGVKWENIAQFDLGSYSTALNATTRLDLSLNDGGNATPSSVMTWQANGNVGFSTTAPLSLLSNATAGTNFVSSNSATQSATGISWLTNNAGYNTSLYNANNVVGSNGLQVKVANTSSQTIAFEVGQNTSQSGISNPYFNVLGNGNVGIGTNAPLTRLIVNDNAYIANLPSSSTNLMDNSTFRPLTRFQTSSGGNNNAISHYLTTTAAATQAHNYSIGTSLPYVLQPAGGNVGIGTTTPSRILDVVNQTSVHTGVIEAETPVTNSTTRAIAIRMRRGTFSAPAAIQNGDVSMFAFSGYDGAAFSPATAAIGGVATENWTSTNKGMALSFYSTPNTSAANNERMRIDHNGNIGIGTTAPAAQLHTTGSVRFAGAGTPAANRVLTSDASGNATWQSAPGTTSVVTRSANFALTVSDNAGFIIVNSASVVDVTVPSTLPAGFYCQIIQQGTGQVRLVGSGVTLNSALGFLTRAQGSSIGIMLATNTLGFVSGDTGL